MSNGMTSGITNIGKYQMGRFMHRQNILVKFGYHIKKANFMKYQAHVTIDEVTYIYYELTMRQALSPSR